MLEHFDAKSIVKSESLATRQVFVLEKRGPLGMPNNPRLIERLSKLRLRNPEDFGEVKGA